MQYSGLNEDDDDPWGLKLGKLPEVEDWKPSDEENDDKFYLTSTDEDERTRRKRERKLRKKADKKAAKARAKAEQEQSERIVELSDDDKPEVIIRTSDELVPIPTSVLEEHGHSRRYARETLLSLIPNSSEFDKIREDLRIQKTVYRYSVTESNTSFERRYYREHGVAPDKLLKKFKITYKGDDLNQFYGSSHPFSRKVLFRPLRVNKPKRRFEHDPKDFGPIKRIFNPHLVSEKPFSRATREPPVSDMAQISRIEIVPGRKNQVTVNEVGGISYSLESRKITAIKWYRERKGQPFFLNSFGVIRALAAEKVLLDRPP